MSLPANKTASHELHPDPVLSELSPIDFAEGINPMTGERVRIPYEEPAAIWTAHPDGYTKAPFVFAYESGVITALNVDRPFVQKGHEIARQLNADIVETLD